MALGFNINATQGSPAMVAKGILGRAEVTVTVDGAEIVTLKNIMIRQGTQGPFVAYPSEKDQTGKVDQNGKPFYYPIYKLWPQSKDNQNRLSGEILAKLGLNAQIAGANAKPAVTASAKAGAKVMVPKAPAPPKAEEDLSGIQW